MIRLPLILLLLAFTPICVADQTPAGIQDCPSVAVSCPAEPLAYGALGTVSARVQTAGAANSITYHWELSSGKIVSGQGTSTITVEPGEEGVTTATVVIGGNAMPPECNKTASCTFVPRCVVVPRRFAEYGRVKRADELARLSNFAVEMENAPSAEGYVIVYGVRGDDPYEKTERLERIKKYLVEKRGIVAERIVTVDGGSREHFTVELWIVPSGAKPPELNPDN